MSATKKVYNKKKGLKKKRPKQTRKKRVGGDRSVKVFFDLGRQFTNPNIRSKVRVTTPTSYEAENRGQFASHLMKEAMNETEENLAVLLKGLPKAISKQKMYQMSFKDYETDNDNIIKEPAKCKRKSGQKKTKGNK